MDLEVMNFTKDVEQMITFVERCEVERGIRTELQAHAGKAYGEKHQKAMVIDIFFERAML